MSDTDSFIDEVTEEVRRDRLFALMKRYGWIAALAVVLIVGGAAWNEWRKAQDQTAAQDFGDTIKTALELPERDARAEALAAIDAPDAGGQAVVDLLAAAELGTQNAEDAASRLLAVADREGIEPVYRQLATLKAVALPGSGLSVEDRRARLDGLALSGGLVRLLAEEQLAMIEIETGETDAAIDRLTQVAQDAQATAGLRRRVSQVIVALGGEMPETGPSGEGQGDSEG
ncbi:hypothetical protein [uncultured Roseovarius sp.]|uniref:hypothetical protein n=1 Tax=uncultured Roseovarius sp. TaxID=293344 RepID=UPI0025D7BA33|nr:hypothetical protein [uncultured Roseovarius sp.]